MIIKNEKVNIRIKNTHSRERNNIDKEVLKHHERYWVMA